MSDKMKEMLPVSREEVEVSGVYRDELGREEYLRKGEEFPSDPVYGTMEWELKELAQEKNSKGHTDDRLIPKKTDPPTRSLSSLPAYAPDLPERLFCSLHVGGDFLVCIGK